MKTEKSKKQKGDGEESKKSNETMKKEATFPHPHSPSHHHPYGNRDICTSYYYFLGYYHYRLHHIRCLHKLFYPRIKLPQTFPN